MDLVLPITELYLNRTIWYKLCCVWLLISVMSEIHPGVWVPVVWSHHWYVVLCGIDPLPFISSTIDGQ